MLIGITGGIGSGKSTIAKQLREMGYAVYDTDLEAKRLIVEDASVRLQMEQIFGTEVYTDGVYQTTLVSQRVFADKSLLAQLNNIVHPAVKADIMQWISNQKSNIQFVECAILYQAGFDSLCDKVVAVTAPEEVRLNRVIARNHSTSDNVRARMRVQEADKYLQRADLVVNNDGRTEIMTICLQIQDFFRNFAG